MRPLAVARYALQDKADGRYRHYFGDIKFSLPFSRDAGGAPRGLREFCDAVDVSDSSMEPRRAAFARSAQVGAPFGDVPLLPG